MSVKVSIFTARLACLFASAALTSSVFATTATVRNVTGAPKVLGKNGLQILHKDDSVAAGATIRTGAGERVDLAIEGNGRLVSLMPSSELILEEGERNLYLRQGELVGSIRTVKETASGHVNVRSPLGLTRVDSGDFSINTLDETVNVLSGNGVKHKPASRLDPVRRAESEVKEMNVPSGRSFMRQNGQSALAPTASKTSAGLMVNVDKLVTADKGGSPIRAALSTLATTSPEPAPAAGTGTPGYWYNHPEAWPVSTIKIGGTYYSAAAAEKIMGSSVSGDVTYTIFAQLAAAKLNVLIGNDPTCIASTISASDTWLADHRLGSDVSGSSTAWSSSGQTLSETLDKYNNGKLCADARQ